MQRTHDGELSGVKGVTKKVMNWMSGNRTIGIQEAQHEIQELPLVICSERMMPVYVNRYMSVRKEKEPKLKDCFSQYANREEGLDLSLSEFFYKVYVPGFDKKTTKQVEPPILHGIGMNYRPVYPMNFHYARGLLILHKPWHKTQFLDVGDEDAVVNQVLSMIERKKFPTSVISQYYRAYQKSIKKEVVAKVKERPDDGYEKTREDCNEEYDEQKAYAASVSHFSAKTPIQDTIGDEQVDIGLHHDWRSLNFTGQRNTTIAGEDYLKHSIDLNNSLLETTDSTEDVLDIPMKNNGEKYKVEDLSAEQYTIAMAVIDTVWKFLTNDPDYKPLRATIMGAGGTGKSHLINTILTSIRELTGCNDSICVGAPSGGAAFNVKGSTLHKLALIKVRKPWEKLSSNDQDKLRKTLKRLLILIIDERSQISSQVIAAAERNVRQNVYSGNNQEQYWGGIPVILLVGDDYQLPPIDEGAILGFANQSKETHNMARKIAESQLLTEEGNIQFSRILNKQVFKLTVPFRQQSKDPKSKQHVDLLERLRTGNPSEDDADKIFSLHLSQIKGTDFKKKLQDHPKTKFLYALNKDVDAKNRQCLIAKSRELKVPVARLRSKWSTCRKQTGKGKVPQPAPTHFDNGTVVPFSDVCVGAKVSIDTVNFEPRWGLFNGVTGVIVDFVYDTITGPNELDKPVLPRYVIVDIPNFKPPPNVMPWDVLNPTVSPYVFCYFIHLYWVMILI